MSTPSPGSDRQRENSDSPPLLSTARVTALSPGSLYRYFRDTLHLDELAQTGDTRVLGNRPYLRAVVVALEPVLSRDDEGARGVRLLRELTDIDHSSSREAHVRRRATQALEWLARRAGVSDEDAPAAPPVRSAPAADSTPAPVLPVVIYLPHIRSPFNLGGILRTAAAFGVAGVVLGPDCPSLSHPRTQRAAMGTTSRLRIRSGNRQTAMDLCADLVPASAPLPPIIALETGGRNIYDIPVPPSGVLVAGHEQLGLSEQELAAARAAGEIVTIPHSGSKASLNVGVAVGIALSWWDAGRRLSQDGFSSIE